MKQMRMQFKFFFFIKSQVILSWPIQHSVFKCLYLICKCVCVCETLCVPSLFHVLPFVSCHFICSIRSLVLLHRDCCLWAINLIIWFKSEHFTILLASKRKHTHKTPTNNKSLRNFTICFICNAVLFIQAMRISSELKSARDVRGCHVE